jgi:hypothetical protein
MDMKSLFNQASLAEASYADLENVTTDGQTITARYY